MAVQTVSPEEQVAVGPDWLRRTGVRSWYLVGILALLSVGLYLTARAASIVVPFLLAIILAVLFSPLVDALEKRRVPRAAGAGIAMVIILFVVGAVGWLLARSIATQIPVIESELTKGFAALEGWLNSLNLPSSTVSSVASSAKSQAATVGGAAAATVFGGLSSIAALGFGAFIAMYMLFFTLVDSGKLADWLGRHMGLREDIGLAIVADSGASIRQYFRGTSILALVTSVATGIGLALVHVPLLVPIMVVTFVMVFIPYIGAIVASIFAVLIALGAGGPQMALLTLVVVLVVQNGLQGAVAGVVLGNALKLHPLVVIMATMLGGVFAGIFGAMLGAPTAAIVVRATGRLNSMSAGPPADAATAADTA